MVHRILRSLFAVGVIDNPPVVKPIEAQADALVAQRVEEQGIVLLKNTGDQLPLRASGLRSIAVIGSHADVGVLSGGGSAQVDPVGGNAVPPPVAASSDLYPPPVWDPSSPLQAIRAKAPNATVTYNAGTDFAAAARWLRRRMSLSYLPANGRRKELTCRTYPSLITRTNSSNRLPLPIRTRSSCWKQEIPSLCRGLTV